ncbi:MAG: DUF2723 domain-containing protein [Planctomycetes bacterium]|nr:DUF2723 domain-containing protein [Planctomycetota bacterium]
MNDESTQLTGSSVGQGDRHSNRMRAWVLGLSAGLLLYGGTVAPGLLWGDSGEAQLQIALDGWYVNGEIVRSHVLYFGFARFLCWLLPVKSALAGNLTAALAGALTIANIAWLITYLVRSIPAVICGTALLLFSHTLWQLSTSAEVVTTTTALMSAELVFFVKLIETRRTRWLAALAFASGLGVSNHNFALLIWPVYAVLIIAWRSAWSGDRIQKGATTIGCLVLGMGPVLALCVDDYLTRGSLGGTFESFLVGHYEHKVSNIGSLGSLAFRSIAMTGLNFPTPVVLLALPGVWRLARCGRRSLAVLLIGGLVMYGGFAVRYNVPDQHTFLVPAYIYVAVLVAVGVDGWRVAGRRWAAYVLIALSGVGPVVYAAAPSILRSVAPDTKLMPTRRVSYRERFSWFIHPWRVGYDGAARYARETLEALPDDAVLGVDTTLAAPINYVQLTEALRRDVRLDCRFVRQDWLSERDLKTARDEALAADKYFVGSDVPRYLPKWLRHRSMQLVAHGHVFRVTSVRSEPDGEAGE